MISLQTNLVALMSQHTLAKADRAIETAIERLATGKRINRAADDPAGAIASTHLAAERSALESEIRQSELSGAKLSAADGALSEVQNLLLQLDSLVIQSANRDALSEGELEGLQIEAGSIVQAIDFVIGSFSFGGERLLSEGFSYGVAGFYGRVGALDVQSLGRTTWEDLEVSDDLMERLIDRELRAEMAHDAQSPDGAGSTVKDGGGRALPAEAVDEPTLKQNAFGLTDLMLGGAANLLDGDSKLAQTIVKTAQNRINNLRGRIGTALKFGLGNGMAALRSKLESVTDMYSQIVDTDYAEETMNLARGQMMRNASLSTMGIALHQNGRTLDVLGMTN